VRFLLHLTADTFLDAAISPPLAHEDEDSLILASCLTGATEPQSLTELRRTTVFLPGTMYTVVAQHR
jgi:hypothetical protein